MTDYIDFVSVVYERDHRTHVAIAPAFTYLKEGDKVIIVDSGIKLNATVKASCPISTTIGDEYKFMMTISDTQVYPRVFAKIAVREFQYEEENEDE